MLVFMLVHNYIGLLENKNVMLRFLSWFDKQQLLRNVRSITLISLYKYFSIIYVLVLCLTHYVYHMSWSIVVYVVLMTFQSVLLINDLVYYDTICDSISSLHVHHFYHIFIKHPMHYLVVSMCGVA